MCKANEILEKISLEFNIEKNKELCERYPFLIPRNRWTGKVPEDYDYSYIEGIHDLPPGWIKLFLQYCEDIRQPLINANYLDKFHFSQIKEKFGTMRLYNFGAPEEVHNITRKYEYISQFVCEICGKPANLVERGWIGSFCYDCFQSHDHVDDIVFNPIMKVTHFNTESSYTEEIDVSDIWNRLYDIKKR